MNEWHGDDQIISDSTRRGGKSIHFHIRRDRSRNSRRRRRLTVKYTVSNASTTSTKEMQMLIFKLLPKWGYVNTSKRHSCTRTKRTRGINLYIVHNNAGKASLGHRCGRFIQSNKLAGFRCNQLKNRGSPTYRREIRKPQREDSTGGGDGEKECNLGTKARWLG